MKPMTICTYFQKRFRAADRETVSEETNGTVQSMSRIFIRLHCQRLLIDFEVLRYVCSKQKLRHIAFSSGIQGQSQGVTALNTNRQNAAKYLLKSTNNVYSRIGAFSSI